VQTIHIILSRIFSFLLKITAIPIIIAIIILISTQIFIIVSPGRFIAKKILALIDGIVYPEAVKINTTIVFEIIFFPIFPVLLFLS